MNSPILKFKVFFSIMLSFLLIGMSLFGSNTFGATESDLFPFKAEGIMFRSAPEPAGSHGFIRVEGDQFVNDQGPVRFWGVNLCMSANFPDKETAVAMARRMASFGINIVRLHHLDTREIWGKNFPRQTEIDSEKLDQLDWLISQFKLNGIYVNINLHVSKKMQEVDGFSHYEERPNHDKGIDNYEPRLIKLQKKYAKDLLTHINPYTKNAYINEPAVAMIEINNENSIISSYFNWSMDNKCPEPYSVPLRVRWNKWLKEKYKTTEELNKAWKLINVPMTGEIIENGSFDDQTLNPKWYLELNDKAVGFLSVSEKSLLFEVRKNGKYNWQPQIFYRPITIKKNMPYTISFRARADEDGKTAKLAIYPSKNLMNVNFNFQKEWKEYTFTLLGTDDIEKARIGFTSLMPGKYYFDDISLKAGGRIGLPENESLECGNVHLIQRINRADNTAPMRTDYMKFLLDLEDNYWQEMYQYVKNELKAQPPITGTQLHYGSAFAQGKLDYIDIHSYWNHPSFPGNNWDRSNWYVRNRPLVNTLGTEGSLANLAATRVIGRPYTVSEYNHPYPNLYAAEGYPMIAALAGFQDWNGIFIFSWGHRFINPNSVAFFDIHGTPFALVHFPACYNLFVRGDVKNGKIAANALKNASISDLSKDFETDAFCKAINGDTDAKNNLLSSPRSKIFEIYSGIRLNDLKIKEKTTAEIPSLDQEKYMELVREKVNQSKSSTGELIWNAQKEEKGYFIVDTEKTKVFSGFVDGRTFTLKHGIKLIPGKSYLDWMTITATELQENRWLISATGLVRNTNMKLRIYRKEDQNLKADELSDVPIQKLKDLMNEPITSCRTEGGSPVLVEGVSAKVILPVPDNVRIYLKPLDENGKPMKSIPAKRLDSEKVEIEIGPQYKTLWYEVEIIIDGSPE